MKKKKTKSSLVLHIVLSFLVWQLIFYLLLNMVSSSLAFSLLSDSVNMIVLKTNVLWIIADCFILLISYLFNKKNTTESNDLPVARRTVLMWFYIFTIGINLSKIIDLIKYAPVMEIVCVIVHVVVIFYLSNALFKKFIEN